MFVFHRQWLTYTFMNRHRHHSLRRHAPGRHKVRLFAGPVRGNCVSTNANHSFCPSAATRSSLRSALARSSGAGTRVSRNHLQVETGLRADGNSPLYRRAPAVRRREGRPHRDIGLREQSHSHSCCMHHLHTSRPTARAASRPSSPPTQRSTSRSSFSASTEGSKCLSYVVHISVVRIHSCASCNRKYGSEVACPVPVNLIHASPVP
jgi:hypothetical protein